MLYHLLFKKNTQKPHKTPQINKRIEELEKERTKVINQIITCIFDGLCV